MKKAKERTALARAAAPDGVRVTPPRSTPPSTDAEPTSTTAVARALLLRVRRYALLLEEQQQRRVTVRDTVERAIEAYLAGDLPAVVLPETTPDFAAQVGTVALDRGLLNRLKHRILDMRIAQSRTVTQREVIEAILAMVLDQAGIAAVSTASPGLSEP